MRGRRKVTAEDKEWASNVKIRDNIQCIICSSTIRLNSHHLFPRENHELSHDLDNGVTLCPLHHRFSREISAHQNPIAFFVWMLRNRPEQTKRILDKWETLTHSD